MRTTTCLLAAALCAVTTLTVHAEMVSISLQGRVHDIVTERKAFQHPEPVGWYTREILHPDTYEGFTREGSFTLHINFDSETGAMGTGELTNSQGQVALLPANPNRPMLSSDEWSIHFSQGSGLYAPSISVLMGFTPGTSPADFSAKAHLDAAPNLLIAAALVDVVGNCTTGVSPFEEALCTRISATFEQVTFATAQQSVTVAIPEPATALLMVLGLASVAGVGISQHRRAGHQQG